MRYAFAGHRPGETFITPHGSIVTNEIDGGAALTEAQLKYFNDGGDKLIEIDGPPPEPPAPIADPVAQAEMAANADAAASAEAATIAGTPLGLALNERKKTAKAKG